MTTFACTLPRTPGLQASIVASRVRTRGVSRSRWVMPRRQLRQVPYCSLRASTPQLRSRATAQLLAARCAGEPLRRGPMESISAWARSGARELSIPCAQMARRIGSSTGRVWAWTARAPRLAPSTSATLSATERKDRDIRTPYWNGNECGSSMYAYRPAKLQTVRTSRNRKEWRGNPKTPKFTFSDLSHSFCEAPAVRLRGFGISALHVGSCRDPTHPLPAPPLARGRRRVGCAECQRPGGVAQHARPLPASLHPPRREGVARFRGDTPPRHQLRDPRGRRGGRGDLVRTAGRCLPGGRGGRLLAGAVALEQGDRDGGGAGGERTCVPALRLHPPAGERVQLEPGECQGAGKGGLYPR